jgi:antitoxin YefM
MAEPPIGAAPYAYADCLAALDTLPTVDPTMPTLYSNSVQMRGTSMTIETTYTQAREQLKTLMDRAVDDREVILVRRRSGDAVAMIAADELQSLLETAHLLRSPKNAERLLAALARARSGDLPPLSVPALEKQFGLEG